jgi:hypothetical protein
VQLHACTTEGTAGKRYSTSNCEQGTTTAEGKFTWKVDTAATKGQITEASSFSLASTVSGIKFKVSCTGAKGSGEFQNEEGIAIGSGITLTLTGCSVTEPAGKECTVPAEISTASLTAKTKEMSATFTPTTGTKFMTIKVSGCSVAALNGEKEVTGSATASVPEMGPLAFTATSGSALNYAAQAATFLGSFGLQNAGGETLGLITP